MSRLRRIASAAVLASALAAGPGARSADDPHAAHRELAGGAPATDRSLYQIPGSWTDQNGGAFALSSLRGTPVVLVLFYGTCDSVCPSIVRDMKKVEAGLRPADRDRTRFVLVTIDPATDTPERLLAYARNNGLDLARWRLLNGGPDQVRVLANVLGIKYRPTGTGQYSHTIRITVVDREGVVVEQADGLARPIEPITARIASLLAADKTRAP